MKSDSEKNNPSSEINIQHQPKNHQKSKKLPQKFQE